MQNRIAHAVQTFHGRGQRGQRVLEFVRHIGGEGLDGVDTFAQGHRHIGQGAGEHPDFIVARGQPRDDDVTRTTLSDADCRGSKTTQRLDNRAPQKQRQCDRQQQGGDNDDDEPTTLLAHQSRHIERIFDRQQVNGPVADARRCGDHRRPVGREANARRDEGVIRHDGFEFGPVLCVRPPLIDIGRRNLRTDDPVENGVHPARDAGVPGFGCRIDQAKGARTETPAVKFKLSPFVINANAVARFLPQRAYDGGVGAGGRRREYGCDKFQFAFLLCPPFLDQPRSKSVEVENAAADKRERNDIHCENPPCQRAPKAPVRWRIVVRRR